ncbi:MAG: redoxin family protein [Bryobacteraceae bacterium]
MTRLLLPFVACLALFAQSPDPAGKALVDEDEILRNALADSSSSTVDLTKALEAHLKLYPNTKRRTEINRALLRAAMDLRDDRRIILYGERVLANDTSDPQFLDRVSRSMLATGDATMAARALNYAVALEQLFIPMLEQKTGKDAAKRREEVERGLGRAMLYQANAYFILKQPEQSTRLAEKSFALYPTSESARELAKIYLAQGRQDDALKAYAEAFTIPDARATDDERRQYRQTLGELYRKVKGSDAGLGDLVLSAYDRSTAIVAERKKRLRELDPNSEATDLREFTLPGVSGNKLSLASLKGKVIVMDFWATWCGPCRKQHPLYQEVMDQFKQRKDIVFLAVNTDDDRSLVLPFLDELKWDTSSVYFEDGLSRLLQVTSIPTTVLVGKDGKIASRMNGFVPERFVDVLTERIQEALKGS